MSKRSEIIDGKDAATSPTGLVYTEVLGWVDLGHARGKDIRHLLSDIAKGESSDEEFNDVTYSQGMSTRYGLIRSGKMITIAAVLIITSVAVFAWPYIKMEFTSSAFYTQNDKREYEYYTPELLKAMPRISDHYSFQYINISGPQALVFGIKFEGITDGHKIRDYLISSGYLPQKQCDLEAECWRSGNSKDEVTLSTSTTPDAVSVQIYRSNYHN